MATQPASRPVTADQFLAMDFGEDFKAELNNGVIFMMAGGTRRHADVAGRIYAFLYMKLSGSNCRPYNSDMAVRTHDLSVRYPDVSVICGRSGADHDGDLAETEPCVIFEVLSDGTARTDLRVKLEEYRAMPSVDSIVFVDIGTERLRILQRTGPKGWSDVTHDDPVDLPLPSLDISLTHNDIFTRD